MNNLSFAIERCMWIFGQRENSHLFPVPRLQKRIHFQGTEKYQALKLRKTNIIKKPVNVRINWIPKDVKLSLGVSIGNHG